MKDISLHILDIAQNSIRAKAGEINIKINQDFNNDILGIEIKDDGIGMDKDLVCRVLDPFYTTRATRKIGLGIPLLKQAATCTGGDLTIQSEPNKGTTIRSTFTMSHIDRPPIGDLSSTMISLIMANPTIRFTYEHRIGEKEFLFDTLEIIEILDGISLSHPTIIAFLRNMFMDELENLTKSIDLKMYKEFINI